MSMTTNSQTLKCKAAICWGMNEPLKVEEIEIEAPKGNEVRIKMLCASFCHTDIICTKYGFPLPLFPRVIGHEGVGVIESIGEDVKELKEGDVVIPTYIGECKECENCKSQNTNLCLKHHFPLTGLMQDGTSRMSIRGQKLYHHFSCSTWSQYTVVDSNYVVKIDPRLPMEHASFLSCGFSTGFGAVWKDGRVEKGSSVAVLGLGAVGLGAIAAAKMVGAAQIIGIDKNERKKEKGEGFGMTHFVNPGESEKPVSELVKELTQGLGVHCCIECTGAPNMANEAIAATKMGQGTMVMVGIGSSLSLDINITTLSMGRTLKGTVFGGIRVQSDLPFIVDKCINKEIELGELLTHEVGLEDINKAFEIVKQQDCVKVVIKIDHEHDNNC